MVITGFRIRMLKSLWTGPTFRRVISTVRVSRVLQ